MRQDRAEDQAADYTYRKGRRGVREGEGRGGRRDHRTTVDQERAGIIEQALAFQDFQDAMRKADLAKYCRRRRGVGWSDDGAERDRGSPWHSRQRVCHCRNRCRRKANRD